MFIVNASSLPLITVNSRKEAEYSVYRALILIDIQHSQLGTRIIDFMIKDWTSLPCSF